MQTSFLYICLLLQASGKQRCKSCFKEEDSNANFFIIAEIWTKKLGNLFSHKIYLNKISIDYRQTNQPTKFQEFRMKDVSVSSI
jgi:hypothetical protein